MAGQVIVRRNVPRENLFLSGKFGRNQNRKTKLMIHRNEEKKEWDFIEQGKSAGAKDADVPSEKAADKMPADEKATDKKSPEKKPANKKA